MDPVMLYHKLCLDGDHGLDRILKRGWRNLVPGHGDARDEKAGHQQVKEGADADDGHRDVAPDRGEGGKISDKGLLKRHELTSKYSVWRAR